MEAVERQGRLTRDERRAQTRERLLDAAADVFNRLGYHGASLEAVAEAAGYTKGAVYSNFSSKAELFVALAERRGVSSGLEATTTAFLAMPIGEFIDGMGEMLRSQAARDEAWDVLTIELWLAAMRDPSLRAVVAHDYREMREELGPLIERKLAEEGIATPFSGPELGSLVSALGSGLILQYYLQPEAVDPDLLPRALRRLLGLPQRAASEPPRVDGETPPDR
ncbi:MAG: TetR/AcrR family transcriptional regulator [Chloroflexi bacterium]|jgi:AcrR family transcriptional regulator|nr:TetR/AcrR family transcriptional regulator [Chloroflexota bacterium]